MLDFFFFFTFASVKVFQTYFCVKLQCILDLFYHLLKKCEYSLILYDLFCLVCGHAMRSCLPLLRIPTAVGHFGIREHWVNLLSIHEQGLVRFNEQCSPYQHCNNNNGNLLSAYPVNHTGMGLGAGDGLSPEEHQGNPITHLREATAG